VLAVRVFMVFNSIGITPEKLECPSWSGAVADILDARNETSVPGVVTGYDRWHFLKVQRNSPRIGKRTQGSKSGTLAVRGGITKLFYAGKHAIFEGDHNSFGGDLWRGGLPPSGCEAAPKSLCAKDLVSATHSNGGEPLATGLPQFYIGLISVFACRYRPINRANDAGTKRENAV